MAAERERACGVGREDALQLQRDRKMLVHQKTAKGADDGMKNDIHSCKFCGKKIGIITWGIYRKIVVDAEAVMVVPEIGRAHSELQSRI